LPDASELINIPHFADTINRLVQWLDGVHTGLTVLEDQQDAMNSYYENEDGN
jgi:hypothetical protein